MQNNNMACNQLVDAASFQVKSMHHNIIFKFNQKKTEYYSKICHEAWINISYLCQI